MNKKYFFFDYDGTLSDRRIMKTVPSSMEAIKKLQANGHFCALATGRAHYKSRGLMRELGLDNGVCAGGGCLVIDNQMIKNDPLDINVVRQLLSECDQNNIGWQVTIDDSIGIYSNTDLFNIQCGGRQEDTTCNVIPDFSYMKQDVIYKCYLSISKQDEYKLPTLSKVGKLRFVPEYLIIQHDNKKQGIIDLMNYLNAPIEDVVVFGDDTNDINMFDSRWTSIAVGNAVDELKALADYVTDNSYDDGVYNACKKYKWI